MNALTGEGLVDVGNLEADVLPYDAQIDRGPNFVTDDQLRRLASARRWRGDRARICKSQKILDERAMPLIAVRSFIVSRKSQGGIQTDLESRVLSRAGEPIPGLYAAGEAAGFGGGGINGAGSLEGTFLSNCILNGRIAARSIAGIASP
jgi:predicted oxidoreductase